MSSSISHSKKGDNTAFERAGIPLTIVLHLIVLVKGMTSGP